MRAKRFDRRRLWPLLLLWSVLSVALLGALGACEQLPVDAPSLLPTPTATNTPWPTPTVTPTPIPRYSPTGFDLFLAEQEEKLFTERAQAVNAYWANLPDTPLTDRERAVFLWRGAASRVTLTGDMNNWSLDPAWDFERLQGTELWYRVLELEPAARLDYKIALDGDDLRLDPNNPRRMMGGFGPNSELAMPGYTPPPELSPPSEPVPSGTLTQHTLESAFLGTERIFFVYTPPGQTIGRLPPSVYIHDGSDYLNIVDAPTLLDRLIAARRIPPAVAVFIPPVERFQEYNRDPAYTDFVVQEVVPFVQATYNTDPDPARTATLGASMGGLIAVHLGITHPETFGLVAGQSGAYMLDENGIIRDIAGQEPVPVRFHILAGSYETAVGGAEGGNIVEASRRLAGVLDSFGYTHEYVEEPQGHSWGFWASNFGRALAYLFE